MKKLNLTVLHRLPNRVRIKLFTPIKDTKQFYNNLKNDLNYLELRYNKITNTLILHFNLNEITTQEIVYRVGMNLSIENGLLPVKIIEESIYKPMSSLTLYSLSSILISSLNILMNKKDIKLQKSMNVFSMSLTLVSVLEHIKQDLKHKGTIDIEILPAFYLIKNFFNEYKLSSVLIVWLTTFCRHLLLISEKSKIMEVYRVKVNDEYKYTSKVSDDYTITNIADLIQQIFYKKSENNSDEKYIILNKN